LWGTGEKGCKAMPKVPSQENFSRRGGQRQMHLLLLPLSPLLHGPGFIFLLLSPLPFLPIIWILQPGLPHGSAVVCPKVHWIM